MKEWGYIHVYHGDGKGKTTCGMGLCCRAAGAGKRVLIYQFMKDGEGSERKALEFVQNVTFSGRKQPVMFSFQMSEEQKEAEKERYKREFLETVEEAETGNWDMLFLDEILYAISSGLLEEKLLTQFLDHKPESIEVILTGRDPSSGIRERADYISEIRKEKHPYDIGLPARKGIER